jgi:hypothetical protein
LFFMSASTYRFGNSNASPFAASADDVLAIDLFNVVRRKRTVRGGLKKVRESFPRRPSRRLARGRFLPCTLESK